MSTHWRLLEHDSRQITALAQSAKVHPLLAHLLLNRGLEDPALARAFLDAPHSALHDPQSLPGAPEAANIILDAIHHQKKIVLYGDYDVDGVCGTSLLWDFLRLSGAQHVDYYIPHRVDEGYGLNPEAIERIAHEFKADMVITIDCGITAVNEAELARRLGLDLIITDHHTLGPSLPEACALVHPALPGSTYPYPNLCGCGVAFKLAWQIGKSFGDGKKTSPHMRQFLLKAINLVALATVADVVPLENENRVFVRHGLKGLAQDPSPGLKALLDISGCSGRKKLSTGALAFSVAPRINAAGRMEKAMDAVELLTTKDPSRAEELARHLDECNLRRQEVERLITAEAIKQIEASGGLGDRGAIVLGHKDWHVGVVGIVAGRLAEIFHRPTVIVSLGEPLAQGSARSVADFDLITAIAACQDGLSGFGGHRAAAGLRLPPDALPLFAQNLDAYCREHLTPAQKLKELVIDAEVRLSELDLSLLQAIDQLEPFGLGNPRPLLVAEDVEIVSPPRLVGQKQNHVQLLLSQGNTRQKAIAWNLANRMKNLQPNQRFSFAFTPSINEWNSYRTVQLEIRDFHPIDS